MCIIFLLLVSKMRFQMAGWWGVTAINKKPSAWKNRRQPNSIWYFQPSTVEVSDELRRWLNYVAFIYQLYFYGDLGYEYFEEKTKTIHASAFPSRFAHCHGQRTKWKNECPMRNGFSLLGEAKSTCGTTSLRAWLDEPARAGPELAGLLLCAKMTFSPVLHEVRLPCWWLMRWTVETRASLILVRRRREPLDILWREVVVFKTDTTRMRRMPGCNGLFQRLTVLSYAFRQLHGHLYLFLLYKKKNIDLLLTHVTLRGREV